MGDVGGVLVATGTRREGACVAGAGLCVIPGGGDAAALERGLREGIAAGARGIISFGMGGALDPTLGLGDMVIASAVRGGFDGVCDPAWVAALARALPGAKVGAVHADGALCARASDKAALFGTGALVVDMESHIAATLAAEAGLPFAVLRCVSDLAGDDLPPVVSVAMGPDGRLALGAAALSVIARPWQLRDVARMLRGFGRGYRAMRCAVRGVEGRLGFEFR